MASPIVFGIGKYIQPDFDDVSQQMGSFLVVRILSTKKANIIIIGKTVSSRYGFSFRIRDCFLAIRDTAAAGSIPQYAAEPQLRKNMHDILSSASSAICAHPKLSALVWIAWAGRYCG